MPQVVLTSITCHKPSEKDKDEIFIKYKGKKIWPVKGKFNKIDTNQTIPITVEIKDPTIWVELELWEYDYLSKNDHLGYFNFKSQAYPGEYTAEMSATDKFEGLAAYTLNWQVIR